MLPSLTIIQQQKQGLLFWKAWEEMRDWTGDGKYKTQNSKRIQAVVLHHCLRIGFTAHIPNSEIKPQIFWFKGFSGAKFTYLPAVLNNNIRSNNYRINGKNKTQWCRNVIYGSNSRANKPGFKHRVSRLTLGENSSRIPREQQQETPNQRTSDSVAR